MKNAILMILLALPVVAQQPPATPAPKPEVKAEAKLPDVKPETKLELRDAQAQWLTITSRILALQKELGDLQPAKTAAEAQFNAAYAKATAEGKKAGVDTDKNELTVPIGDSAGIRFIPKAVVPVAPAKEKP